MDRGPHPHDCPICQAFASRLEALDDGYQFCSKCGHVFKIDDHGRLIRLHLTNHTRLRGLQPR